MKSPEKQPYPCVVMESPNHRHTKSGHLKDDISQHDIRERTFVYYPVTAFDDLTHVDFCREHKGFAVVEYQNLDLILTDKPHKAKEVVMMKRKLNGLIRPPELVRAEKEKLEKENAELHAEIEKLKAAEEARMAEEAAKAKAAQEKGKEPPKAKAAQENATA